MTITLGPVQAFVLGDILFGTTPADPETAILWTSLPGVDDAERLTEDRPFRMVLPNDVDALWSLHTLLRDAANVRDEQLEGRFGRGVYPDQRKHLCEELRALGRLGDRIVDEIRKATKAAAR